MDVVSLIIRKRDGGVLSSEEIKEVIEGYTAGSIPDYQMSALLMAVFFRGLNKEETWAWTKAMLESGEQIDLSHVPGPKVDKHSTGGVGDKISIPLAPLVAALGVKVPMITGRGLGHTGGTLDKLDSIPGFNSALTVSEFIQAIEKVGVAMIGQTAQLAPADKKVYALRDVTGTVESIPLICASIMSKKLAEGIGGLVLDVKTGSGAFMKSLEASEELARTLVGIGESAEVKTVALISNMDQPLGWAVGNALEIQESIEILQGKGPEDTTELTLQLAGYMQYVGGLVDDPAKGVELAREAIHDGRALLKFKEMVRNQGGDPGIVEEPERLPQARATEEVLAPQDGYISAMDTMKIGRAGVVLGGGRLKKEDTIDPAVGFRVLKKVGDRVSAGEPIAVIYYNDEDKMRMAKEMYEQAVSYSKSPVQPLPLIYKTIKSAD